MAVTVRLAPLLPTNVAVVQFPDVRKATEAVIDILNSGVGVRASDVLLLPFSRLRPSSSPFGSRAFRIRTFIYAECVELVDDNFMRATNMHGLSARKWPEKDSLFFKFQGPTPRALQESAEIVKKISARYGGTGFELARGEKEAADLWTDRKNGFYSSLAILPGAKGWSTDVWYVAPSDWDWDWDWGCGCGCGCGCGGNISDG